MVKLKCHEKGRMPEPEYGSPLFLFFWFPSHTGLVYSVGKIVNPTGAGTATLCTGSYEGCYPILDAPSGWKWSQRIHTGR